MPQEIESCFAPGKELIRPAVIAVQSYALWPTREPVDAALADLLAAYREYFDAVAADLLLQPMWRMMGPVESVTGVLMCGLSASFLFAIVTRLIALQDPGLADPHVGGPAYAIDRASEQIGLRQRETVNMRDAVVARTSGKVTRQL